VNSTRELRPFTLITLMTFHYVSGLNSGRGQTVFPVPAHVYTPQSAHRLFRPET